MFYLFYTTNSFLDYIMCLFGQQQQRTAVAAAVGGGLKTEAEAGAQDVTRLEPQVCFFFLFSCTLLTIIVLQLS